MPKRVFENNELLNCNIICNQYCFNTDNDKLLQGYYAKLQVNEDNVNNQKIFYNNIYNGL